MDYEIGINVRHQMDDFITQKKLAKLTYGSSHMNIPERKFQ